jgi:hypothetical protein
MGVNLKPSSLTRVAAAAWAAVIIQTGSSSAWAQSAVYEATGGFTALSGASEVLPPGVTQGSTFTGQFNFNTAGYTAQPGTPGEVFTLPAASLIGNFINGLYDTEVTYTDLTLDFSANPTGGTSVTINAWDANSAFTLSYTGGAAPDNSLASVENFLNAGYYSATGAGSSAQLTYDNPLPDGPTGVATGDLVSLVPEPRVDGLLVLGAVLLALKARRKLDWAGRPPTAASGKH